MSAQAEADEVIAQLRAEVLVMQESAGAEAILVANAAAGASWSQPRTWGMTFWCGQEGLSTMGLEAIGLS